MAKKKQSWRPGDVFVVPQSDGVGTVGQILDHVMANVASCALYDIRVPLEGVTGPFDLTIDRLIATLSVTREQLDFGKWRVIGWQPVTLDRAVWPNENCRSQEWIGAKIFDAALAEDLLEAYNGLAPWDDWKDPEYLDKLLVNPDRRPKHLVFKRKSEGT